MKKNFTVILPDEPYKTSTDKNNSIECVYEGPQYLVARLDNSNNKIQNIVDWKDSLEDINLDNYKEENHSFIIINAAEKPFEAAFASNVYSHGDVENYKETLPTGETWEYYYEDKSGILSQIYFPFSLGYNTDTKQFSGPDRRTHFLTRESSIEGMKNMIPTIEKALEINDYTDEERTRLEQHKTWLENLETTYADVDHWKIPYPTDLPRY